MITFEPSIFFIYEKERDLKNSSGKRQVFLEALKVGQIPSRQSFVDATCLPARDIVGH